MTILRDLRLTKDVTVYVHDNGKAGFVCHSLGVRVSIAWSASDARSIGLALIEAADVAEGRASPRSVESRSIRKQGVSK